MRQPESEFARIVDDETFVKRAFLDATGKAPESKIVGEFVAHPDRRKRDLLVNSLLGTEDFARKWARYWRAVIFHGSNANRNNVNPQALEDWLADQFKDNVSWDQIVAELVSARPKYNKNKRKEKNQWGQKHGPNNFVLACENKAPILASQTARLFMGISIGCAECHDHPFDDWKREQFHELAAFFSNGKYQMTDMQDPKKKIEMQPRFLLGETPPGRLDADQRRVYIAGALIYNPDNYWFARAYVNRVWNELVGDGFYSVDSLGPDKDCLHQHVVNRLAYVFRYRNFDTKWLFATIMNTDTYQREIRTITNDGKLFTGVRPTRLGPNEIAASLARVTGKNDGLAKTIRSTFSVDPSVPQRDLEGSLQQALLLMNNGTLHGRLRASELRRRVLKLKTDDEVIREVFLGVLARTPSNIEKDRYREHFRKVKPRDAAVDDLVWVLVNSTEFLARR